MIGEQDKRKRYDALRKGGADPYQSSSGPGAGGFTPPNFDAEKIKREAQRIWGQFYHKAGDYQKDFKGRMNDF